MILEAHEPTALYRLFDDADRLLYVGITRDVEARLAAHSRTKRRSWWPLVARREVTWFDTREMAAQAELEAIRTEDPIHNVAAIPAARRYESPDSPMLTFTQIAKRLHARGIVEKEITRQGVRHIAETDPEWPIPPEQWLKIGNAFAMDWAPVEEFFRSRETKGRGKDLKPRKRTEKPAE